jgi:hypothetical protein
MHRSFALLVSLDFFATLFFVAEINMLVTIAVILVILSLLGDVFVSRLGRLRTSAARPCHHHGADQDHSGPKSTLEFSVPTPLD